MGANELFIELERQEEEKKEFNSKKSDESFEKTPKKSGIPSWIKDMFWKIIGRKDRYG